MLPLSELVSLQPGMPRYSNFLRPPYADGCSGGDCERQFWPDAVVNGVRLLSFPVNLSR